MAQDPAFLFYYKDILVSCADWEAHEIGWYTRLLCHQADKPEGLSKDIEKLALMAGVKFSDYQKFVSCWNEHIKKQFIPHPDTGLLINAKQAKNLDDRRIFKENQAEKGLIGYWIKRIKSDISGLGHPWETLEQKVKKSISENVSKERTKEQNEGFVKGLLEEIKLNPLSWTTSIYGDVIGDGDGDVIGNNTITGKGGIGEKPFAGKYIVPAMLEVYKKNIPLYGEDISRDYKPLQSIAEYLFKYFKLPGDFLTNQKKILDEWEVICEWITKDSFYHQKSLKTISAHIQEMVNKSTNGEKQKTTKSATVAGKHEDGLDALLARGKQKYAATRGENNGS